MPHKVVHLGHIRDLRAAWDTVRQSIVRGELDSFYLAVRGTNGKEVIYSGGAYKTDAKLAVKAALRVSAARMLVEDEPPPEFANSQF